MKYPRVLGAQIRRAVLWGLTDMKFYSLLLLGGLLVVGTAHGAKFGVKVVSETGEPLAGVAVCVGTHGNYRQFGTMITSRTGDAVVDVPNVPLVVTISKNRFTGVRMTEPSRSFNLIKKVELREGVPGPRCRAGTSLANENHPIEIDNVLVKDGLYSFTLLPTIDGEASHYRLSASQNFSQARWTRLDRSINVPMELADAKTLFLQVRKLRSAGNSWLEARSNVVAINMPRL